MLCHDPGTAHVIDLALEHHAHGGRLGIAANHGAMSIAIYDRIPDDVDALPLHRIERFPKLVESNAVSLHQDLKLFQLDRRRGEIDQIRGGIDHVAGSENDLAALGLHHFRLLGRLFGHACCRVLESLRDIVWLDETDVLDRRVILIDYDLIDHIAALDIYRAQVLRDL